jgi:exonuclease III
MSNANPHKRQKTDTEASVLGDPHSIVTWNADGLAARSKHPDALTQFPELLRKTNPHLICIQEARLRCDRGNRDKPQPSEWEEVAPLFQHLTNYEPVWSLADKRNAGTLLLIHHDLIPADKKKKTVKQCCAFSVTDILELLLRVYGLTDDDELKSALKLNADPKPKQASLKSFFQTQNTTSTSNHHHEEGRIQFVRFANLDVLHTYVPNNGMKSESFERRRNFDVDMQRLLVGREAILKKALAAHRPILWVGDLNVARTYLDGTDYSVNSSDGTVKEYWTNEAQCLGKSAAGSAIQKDASDIGMPGFTRNERHRFEECLGRANLTDVWRKLHPDGVTLETLPFLPNGCGGCKEENPWNKAEYTWRGSVAKTTSPFEKAKYQGKGQRIDYFLLSSHAVDRVESCDILGYGELREGFFCGSDHSASLLVFKKNDNEQNKNE